MAILGLFFGRMRSCRPAWSAPSVIADLLACSHPAFVDLVGFLDQSMYVSPVVMPHHEFICP